MGSKNPTTSTNNSSSSTYNANPAVQSATQNLVGSATKQSGNPYQAFTGQMVSGTTGQQQLGYGQIQNAAGVFAPFLQSATGALNGIPQFNAATMQNYMSPYTSSVVQSTEAQLNNQDQQQQAALTGNAISAGAFGGDRAAVAASVLGGQQDIANNATIANLENTGYLNAQNELNTQQQTGLNTGAAYGALGTTALGNTLNAAGANIQAGTQQQQTQTAIDQGQYQLYQSALAYPYQNLSWLSSILGGAGSTLGGTTNATGQSTSTQTGVSNIGPILGGLTSLFSLSDERTKENIEGIGKLFDGTPVVKFNYKGHPQTQIGLLAQDVEKKHPDSVAKDDKGIRYVNYDTATEDAAERKHFASGGIVMPYGGDGNNIIPLSSAGTGGSNGQQQSEAGAAAMMSSLGHGGGSSSAASNPYSQIAGVLQNKTSMHGIQNVMQGLQSWGGIPNSMGAVANDFSLPISGLFSGGFSHGGSVARKGFADGGAPYGDLSGVDFGSAPDAGGNSGISGLAMPMSLPADAIAVPPAAAPSSPAPAIGLTSAPATGLAAINGALKPTGDNTFARMLQIESGGRQFNADGSPVVSPKGAVGIAQIMPGTAPEAASLAGLPYDPARLTSDPQYNQALGKAYYQKQLATFGSPEIAAAAYNAGPAAVSRALALASKDGSSYLDHLPQETQDYVAKVAGGNNGALPQDALAFSGGAPSASGSPASASAQPASSAPDSNPISGIGKFFSGLMPGASNTQGVPADAQHQMGGINPFGLSDNARMGILAAGLGMMGSKAHWGAEQVGEGGLAGLQAYMGLQNQSRLQAQTQSDVAYKQGMLGIEQRKANILYQNAMNIAKSLNGPIPGAPSNGTGTQGPDATAPITGSPPPTNATPMPMSQGQPGAPVSTSAIAPTASATPVAATPNPVAKGDPTFWNRVAPSSNPAYLDMMATRYERTAAAAGMVPEQAASLANTAMQYRRTAQQIRSNGQVTMQDGSIATIPGFAASQAQITAAKSAGEHLQTPTAAGILERDPNNPGAPPKLIPWSQVTGAPANTPQVSAGTPVDTRLLSPEGAKGVAAETNPILASAAKSNDAAQSTLYRVADMRNELEQLPSSGWLAPGTGFAERSDAAKSINTAFSMLGIKDKNLPFDANSVASGQALQKLTRTMGFDLARTLGSREAAMIINQAVGTVPSADNTPLGAKRLLASIGEVAQRQIDWYNYAQQWASETGGSLLGASAKFNAIHPPQQYAARALVSTLPPPAVALLRQKPGSAAWFDHHYGPGSAKLVLGTQNGQ